MVMMDMDVLTTVFLVSKAFTKVLQTHMRWKSPNFVDPAPDPKYKDGPINTFFGSESLQSLFVFLFTFPSFSCFLKHLASHKTYQGPIMLLIHSWADARCVIHLWLGWGWIPAAWELWMWLFVTQGGTRQTGSQEWAYQDYNSFSVYVVQLVILVSPIKICILGQGLCLLFLTQSWVLQAFTQQY